MEINPDKFVHALNECVREQLTALITEICEKEGLNFVEIATKYGLLQTINRDYKPKKKTRIKNSGTSIKM